MRRKEARRAAVPVVLEAVLTLSLGALLFGFAAVREVPATAREVESAAARDGDSLLAHEGGSAPSREGGPAAASAGAAAKAETAALAGVSNPVDPRQLIPPPCPLCAGQLPVPLRVLSYEDARGIGAAYADSNVTRLAFLDSLLQAGHFGPSTSRSARRQAQLLARLLTLNAYSYMIRYGTDSTQVWQADETTLKPAFDSFSDPGIVPLARLTQARMGLGHMCARYDLSEKIRSETTIGDMRLSVRVDDVTIQGQPLRALIMDLPTSLNDVVEVWMTEHVSMDVRHLRVEGPPAPYEAYVVENMRGLWVHKAGMHRPEAFVFWVTPREPRRTEVPPVPLVGARIYVPHLVLRLPSILPDIGFDDLREVDLPQPILALDFLKHGRAPLWLRPARQRGFEGWEGVGPVPEAIRARFPDY